MSQAFKTFSSAHSAPTSTRHDIDEDIYRDYGSHFLKLAIISRET
jgi:hypothetical protein